MPVSHTPLPDTTLFRSGVSAAAPVAMVAGGGAGAAAAAPAAEAKTAFDVILASVPADKKIAVIKAVRDVKAGLGLAEAKDRKSTRLNSSHLVSSYAVFG